MVIGWWLTHLNTLSFILTWWLCARFLLLMALPVSENSFQRALFALTIGVPSKLAVPVQLIEVLLGMRPNLGPTSRLHYALDHLPVLAVLA